MRPKTNLRLIAAILAVLVIAAPTLAGPQYREITILHTNDTHAHLIPFSYPDQPSSGLPNYRDIGGIARRATLAHQIEREMKRNVLLVDAGDELDGTPFSVEYMGLADVTAMSAAGYDLKTFGNHEFSANLAEFKRNVSAAHFPTVCANLIERATGKFYEPRYKIMDFEGVKVAFFGLVTPVPDYNAAKAGYDFRDPIETARELVPELHKSADIVIAITHIGEDQDEVLARQVSGIDAIVGGHSHTRLAQPVVINSPGEHGAFDLGGTVIVQAGQWGQELGRLDLRFRGDDGGHYRLMSYSGKLLPVTSDIPDDPDTAQAVVKFEKPMLKEYGQTLGEATASFHNDGEFECPTMNLVCDAMREHFGSDVAFYNYGGVRADLVSGPVKMWDIATMLPFRDNVASIKMDGKALKSFVTDTRPGVSGLRYVIAADGKLAEATINGKPVDDAATYTVVINDFFVGSIKDARPVDTGKTIRDVVAGYIRSKKTITPVLDGRQVLQH